MEYMISHFRYGVVNSSLQWLTVMGFGITNGYHNNIALTAMPRLI